MLSEFDHVILENLSASEKGFIKNLFFYVETQIGAFRFISNVHRTRKNKDPVKNEFRQGVLFLICQVTLIILIRKDA